MRILLVEDDPQLGESLEAALRLERYAVDWLRGGEPVRSTLSATPYDLLILDLGLPGVPGMQVLRQLRADKKTLPVLLLYFGVSRGLLPLKTLAGQIARRNPGLLDPVRTDGVPVEVQGVVASLNQLLERLAFALESDQRFTANAAHELMTPLAAIKTEVQLCQRQVEDSASRALLARIALRVDRASHTVEQLLTLARVDPDAPLPLSTLAILLRNLLVNAFRYARDDSAVRIDLQDGEGPRLTVCNDCEAIPAEEFGRITERFYRVPGSAGLGAGLGLSIVSRIADQHSATFSASPGRDGGGFCALVRFPPGVTAGL